MNEDCTIELLRAAQDVVNDAEPHYGPALREDGPRVYLVDADCLEGLRDVVRAISDEAARVIKETLHTRRA